MNSLIKKHFFLLFFYFGVMGDPHWRKDYTFYEECNGWVKFHDVPMTWHDARLMCHYEGSELAAPTPDLINTMTDILIASNTPSAKMYTGIHATFFSRLFSSMKGIPLWNIPHKWAEGKPDNNSEENCIALNQIGKLEDLSCNLALPFMCYKKNESLKLNICGTIDNEYTPDTRTGNCYKFHRYPHSWDRAYMICQAEGGYLAVINSATEAQVIKDIFLKNPTNSLPRQKWPECVFLGYRDELQHGEWLTIQDETLKEAGYERFGDGLPSNAAEGRNCGGALRTGLLVDLTCGESLPFICEKDPHSLTCTF